MSYFVLVPLKRTINRGVKKDSMATAESTMPPPADLSTLEQHRQRVHARIEGFKPRLEAPLDSIDSWRPFATPALRETAVQEWETECNEYLRFLIDTVTTHRALAGHYFYFWGSSFTDRVNRAFDDYRYEVACVSFNMGAVCANLARYVARPSVTANSLELAAKESYGLLCKAATYFSLAKQAMDLMATSPTMSSKEEMVEDAKPAFLELLTNTMLGQAQEMGLLKALTGSSLGENWKKSPLPPKLSQRVVQLYDAAVDTFQSKVTNGSYRDSQSRGGVLLKELQLKRLVAQTQAAMYHATCRFEDNPKEGLWFLAQHRATLPLVANAAKALGSSMADAREWVGAVERTWRNEADRIDKINSLVSRAKADEGPHDTAAPQELARIKTDMTFPSPLI